MKKKPIICKNCEETFYGRRGKLFCDSKCRSDFHNKRYKIVQKLKDVEFQKNEIFKHINNIAQITDSEIDKIHQRIRQIKKNSTEHEEAQYYYSLNYGIRSEILKIKSILLNEH